MTDVTARCEEFRELHRPGSPLFLPNAWDFASAVALAQRGYPAIGTTSLGVSAAAGKADSAGQALAENVSLVRRLSTLPALLTVDIEYGFSDDPRSVADLAEELAGAGAVGVNIEDGRPDGTLTAVQDHCAKIAAVKDRVPTLFVNARTDAFWFAPPGTPPPTDEAISRGTAFIAAGADGVFVPAAADPAIVALLAAGIAAPLNILYMPGRHTVASLAAAGVARISTGSLLFREALRAALDTADTVSGRGPGDSRIPSYGEVQAMITAY